MLNLPAAINVLLWLVRDTFRQAFASRIFAVMLTVTGIAVLFCASIGVRGGKIERSPGERIEMVPRGSGIAPEKAAQQGVSEPAGELSLAFGTIRVDLWRDADEAIHYLQLILAAGVAGTLGILITLIWTAGFLPTFLEPAAAAVLLTKPVPPWLLVLGKYIGMVLFVGVQAALFVGGTWLTLGLKTGVWTQAYLLAVPLLMLEFAFFYSVSMLLAVTTRSTIVCIVGSVLFWFLCTAVNTARIDAVIDPSSPTLKRHATEAAYWVLPKPVDFNLVMSRGLNAGPHFASSPKLREFEQRGRATPEWSIVTSLLFAISVVAVSALGVRRVDY